MRSCALPKDPLFRLVSIPSKFGWLSRFNASKRNCAFTASVTLKFFISAPSKPLNHGPRNRLRPNVPKRTPYPGGLTNSLLGVLTPYDELQAATASAEDCMPGNPQPIGLLSTKMPSAGL